MTHNRRRPSPYRRLSPEQVTVEEARAILRPDLAARDDVERQPTSLEAEADRAGGKPCPDHPDEWRSQRDLVAEEIDLKLSKAAVYRRQGRRAIAETLEEQAAQMRREIACHGGCCTSTETHQ